jgi:uncharacterized membrane protein
MAEGQKSSGGSQVLLGAACFVVVVAGMKAASSLLVPFLLAIFIAVICLPPMSWMQKKGIPAGLAILLIVVAIFGLFTLLGTFVGGPGGLFPNSQQEQTNLLYGLLTMILSAVSAGAGIYFLTKHLGAIPFLGRLVLSDENDHEDLLLSQIPVGGEVIPQVGALGKSITPLRPSGRAQIGEQIIDVVSGLGYVDPGQPVRVVSADEYRVVVEHLADHNDAPAPDNTPDESTT